MTSERDKNDLLFNHLIQRAIVPRGFRPQSDEEIESMLNALGNEDLPDDKLNRMLGKIHGEVPMGRDTVEPEPLDWNSDSSETRELAEMFRERGEELSPELEEKLREMEKRAAELPDEEVPPDDK